MPRLVVFPYLACKGASFHEGMVGQSAKVFTHECRVHEKDVPNEGLRIVTDGRHLTEVPAMQLLFMQYVFANLRYLLCECDRYIHHFICDHSCDLMEACPCCLVRESAGVLQHHFTADGRWKVANTPRWKALLDKLAEPD